MRKISWQLVVIIGIVCSCITTLELYALSQGVNGTVLALIMAGLVGIPSVIITRKLTKRGINKCLDVKPAEFIVILNF